MGRKKHPRKGMMHSVRGALKVATKVVFTASGLIVATAPLHRGLASATTSGGNVFSNLQAAGTNIVVDVTGAPPGGNMDIGKLISTALVVGLGAGLIIAGNKLAKRI